MQMPIYPLASESQEQAAKWQRKNIQTHAIKIAKLRLSGHIRVTQIAIARANAATTRVCPLGKLEPQYPSVSYKEGRVRSSIVFKKYTTITPLITEVASNMASKRRFAKKSATTMAIDRGNRTCPDPEIVIVSKSPSRDFGTFACMNCNRSLSAWHDPPVTTS
jgi:hypothetical protein